jgi:hypothetical protein
MDFAGSSANAGAAAAISAEIATTTDGTAEKRRIQTPAHRLTNFLAFRTPPRVTMAGVVSELRGVRHAPDKESTPAAVAVAAQLDAGSQSRTSSRGTVLSITLQPSRNPSAPTAFIRRDDGREFYLHSRYDPVEEGQFLAHDVAKQERTLYVVLGFGLGYHVRAILDQVPASSQVVVVEPDAMCLSARAAADAAHPAALWMNDPRLHLLAHHDPKLAPLHLADRMAALRLLSIKLVTHVPTTLTAEEYYRSVASEIPEHLPANIQRHLSSLDRTLESDLRNFWANLRYSWRAAPVSRLRGRWRGAPLVIVSGGPSLTDALPRLPELRERALMLATGSTARVLIERGIQPDLVISVDPYGLNLAHFVGWDTSTVPLVYYHRVHHAILPVYNGPLCSFVMQDEPPLPLLDDDRAPFHRGGTVAFSALQLAHYLEADPVVFVGQDFAFAGGRTHAAGAIYGEIFDETAPPDDYILIPGVDGRPVMTSRIHQAYLLHMQDYVLNYSKRRSSVRHINTSRLGARMRGVLYQDLDTTLRGLEPLANERSRDLRPLLSPSHVASRTSRRERLDCWIEELTRALASSSGGQDFDALIQGFARTSVFQAAATAYSDLCYVYEAKYQKGANAAAGVFVNRFRDHLRQVLADLRETKDAL